VAVGQDSELTALTGAHTRVVDLQGRLVTPGLWDSHIHLYHWCRARKHLKLGDCADKEEVLERVRAVPASQEWVVGWHLNCTRWEKAELPTRYDLDSVCSDRPVILWLSDLHSAVANTYALELAGLTAPNSMITGGVVEVDVHGKPTGILRELAANCVRDHMPEPSWSQLRGLLKEGVSELNRFGVTSISDQRIKDLDDGSIVFRALRNLECDGKLSVRVCCNVAAHHLERAGSLGMSTGFGTDFLRIGHLKVFSDGTLGSKTARMLQPLIGEEQCGLYLTPPEEMEDVFRRASELGYSISVHSIGDESCRVCLDIFEQMRKDGITPPKIPHRVEHAQIVSDADVSRFADLELTISAQPGHVLDDRFIADDLLAERGRTAYRFHDFDRAGALLAFGTDAPVSTVDPRYGLQAAVHRGLVQDSPWYPEQALSFERALWGYTLGPAKATGWSSRLGSLAQGALADLAVWSKGVEKASNFLDHSVELTVSGGQIVYDGMKQASTLS
jgi:predicted amidohydrolase YtcJ